MTLPRTWFALTLTVRLVEPLAGTVTLAGNEILASPAEVVPAPQMVPSAPAAGVNLRACRLNDAELALAFVSLRLTLVGVLIDPLTLPKLAATGAKATVATAELDRFSRPPPCWVGPTPSLPFDAFLMTRSAVLTRADFTRAGDQVGWRASSTAADPAMCGVAMDVPLKNAQASALHGLAEHGMELRTLTPTDVRSGLTARSTFVGPWLLKPARISAFGVMNSLKDASADAVVAPEARSAAPCTMPIMTAGGHARAPIGGRVEQVVAAAGEWREVTHGRADGRPTAGRIGQRLPDEVLVRAGAGGDDVPGAARRLDRLRAGARVSGRDRHDDTGVHGVVEAHGQQVCVAVVAAAERQVQDIHAVEHGRVHGVEDVLAAGVGDVAREDVVVAQPGAGRDARHVVDRDALDRGDLAGYTGHGAGDVGAVFLGCAGVEAADGRLVVEHLGDDDLGRGVLAVRVDHVSRAVSRVALREARRGGEARGIEERMAGVDAGIDDSDLDAPTGIGAPTGRCPGGGGVDDLVALAHRRVVQRVVLEPCHVAVVAEPADRRAVELDGDAVEGRVEVGRDSRGGHVRPQPGCEGRMLRPQEAEVFLGGGAAGVLLAAAGPRPGVPGEVAVIDGQRLLPQHDDGRACVQGGAPGRLVRVRRRRAGLGDRHCQEQQSGGKDRGQASVHRALPSAQVHPHRWRRRPS